MSWASSRLAALPLAAAYLAVPLATALVRRMGPEPAVSPFLPWLLLAGLGTVWAMLFRRSGVRVKKRFVFEVFAFLALAVMLYLRQDVFLMQIELALPLIVEAAPAWVLGFCLMWAMTFGVPDRAAFQRYGAALGLLCIADLTAGIVLQQAATAQRWLGDPDVLAGLLLVALCAGLRPGENDGGAAEPDQGRPSWRAMILLGLAACLSRTGLFGAAWIYLFFGRGSRTARVLTALALFLLMAATFLAPLSRPGGMHYLDYWLWAKSVELFFREPGLLFTGVHFGLALPFAIPQELAPIWERLTGSPEQLGVQLAQIGPFWLRFILGWGALVPLAGLAGLFGLLFRRMTRMGAGLAAVLFAMGISTPLFHDPGLGVSLGLAFILALSAPKPRPEIESATHGPDAEDATDPARQWDMRPL